MAEIGEYDIYVHKETGELYQILVSLTSENVMLFPYPPSLEMLGVPFIVSPEELERDFKLSPRYHSKLGKVINSK